MLEPRRQVLIARGIERAWSRLSPLAVRSGARVKLRERPPVSVDGMRSMIKRLWIDSETSALTQQGTMDTAGPSTAAQTSLQGSARRISHVGIQTTSIVRVDRQTSCDSISSSTTTRQSSSETSTTDGSSSASTSSTDRSREHSRRQNRNRNNNAVTIDQDEPLTVKRRLFASLFRFSFLKRDPNSTPTFRCRRSRPRNCPVPPAQPQVDPPIASRSTSRDRKHRKRHKQRSVRRRRERTPKDTSPSEILVAPSNVNNSSLHESAEKIIVNNEETPASRPVQLRVKKKKTCIDSRADVASPLIDRHQMNVVREYESFLRNTVDGTHASSVAPRNQHQHHDPSEASSDSRSPGIVHPSAHQTEIIREGVDQLLRYQGLAQSYRLKSNPAVKQFLLKSVALSPEMLHQLSSQNQTK